MKNLIDHEELFDVYYKIRMFKDKIILIILT